MGEIAEMMLEGGMCQWCGEILDSGGYPQICAGCQAQYGVDQLGEPRNKKSQKQGNKRHSHRRDTPCPQCGRLVKAVGLEQHQRANHGKIE
jgi:hypothetical protein